MQTARQTKSPGDLILAKPVNILQPSTTTTSNRLPVSSQPSTLLSVPSETAQTTVARGRKCSIVTEEEDDEENEDSGRDSSSHSSCHSLLNRRGSRSEGKLSLALQERLAESRNKEPRPVTAVIPKPCPRYHKSPVIARINTKLSSAATVSIPVITNTTVPSPSKFKTLPTPSRPLHSVCSSPQLALNEIFEEGTEKVNNSTPVVPVVPRVVVTRQKFHKNRTASCSSSDASDEDSESRKKRAHKLKTLPGNSRRRDSHDDSSDSQGGQGGGGGGNAGGGSGSPENTSVNESNDKQQQSSSSGGNSNGRRHTGFRRRCGTAGETRLRESQSLNRITEVQESSESLVQTLQNTSTVTQATSPRSRRSFGARFLLLVGGSKKSSSSSSSEVVEKENCSTTTTTTTNKTKITRYFHLHRKLCLPIFKPNSTNTNTSNHHHSNHHHHHSATNINNNNSASTNDVWLGASKHG